MEQQGVNLANILLNESVQLSAIFPHCELMKPRAISDWYRHTVSAATARSQVSDHMVGAIKAP